MEKYFSSIKENLKKLISIDSVQSEPLPDKPFGEGAYEALNFVLSLARDMGFETKNYDNYICEVIFGDGEEEMAILCHLDVVPVGSLSAWKYPPFSATEADGKIYGRGATDDKGPSIVCLYCLKALKDEGFVPNKKIKLIFGCNEESGWGCIRHYNEVAKMPEFGFSPDAGFPVIYSEKGIIHVKFYFDKPSALKSISGGTAGNVVCDKCEAIAPLNEEFAKEFGVKKEGDKLVTTGKSAHGSTPDKGINAIDKMIRYLVKIGAADERIEKFLFDDELGLKNLQDETGRLTLSPNIIGIEGGEVFVIADVRYPATISAEKILSEFEKISRFEVLGHQKPLYNDKNGFLIKTLANVYNGEMGTNEEPIAIGGGTYARALKCGAGFGPEMRDEDCNIHQPNEFVSLENLKLQFRLYKLAIKRLSE